MLCRIIISPYLCIIKQRSNNATLKILKSKTMKKATVQTEKGNFVVEVSKDAVYVTDKKGDYTKLTREHVGCDKSDKQKDVLDAAIEWVKDTNTH